MFFMPHCPFRLYSNVLWANWSPSLLSRVTIVGNSFSAYDSRSLSASARQEEVNCVLRVARVTEEHAMVIHSRRDLEALCELPCLRSSGDAFGDLGVMWWSEERLRGLMSGADWSVRPTEVFGMSTMDDPFTPPHQPL